MNTSKLFFVACCGCLLLAISCSKNTPTNTSVETNRTLVIVKSAEPETENNGAVTPGHLQLGAHVHGSASMNVIIDNARVDIAMSIPGMDAVGFEHPARTPEEQEKLEKTLAYLQTPDSLFGFPTAAACTLIKGEVTTALLNKEVAEKSHADVDVSYQWACAKSDALKNIHSKLFNYFPSMQKIHVNWILQDRQGATEFTPAYSVLTFD